VLHHSEKAAIQMPCFCRAKQSHKLHFGGNALPIERELGGELLRGCSKSWIWFDSSKTSELELFYCRATIEPNYNYVRYGTSTTSEVGLDRKNNILLQNVSVDIPRNLHGTRKRMCNSSNGDVNTEYGMISSSRKKHVRWLMIFNHILVE